MYTTQDNGLSAGVKSTEGTGPPTLQHKHIAHTKAKYTPNYNTTLHLLCNSPLRKIHLCVVVFIFDYIGPCSSAFLSGRLRGAQNALSLVKRLSKLQPVGPSGCTKASWRCQSGACRNERNVPLLIWVTQAPSALTRLLGSRTRNPFSLARLNMKYRTGVEGGKAEERGRLGVLGLCLNRACVGGRACVWVVGPRTKRCIFLQFLVPCLPSFPRLRPVEGLVFLISSLYYCYIIYLYLFLYM